MIFYGHVGFCYMGSKRKLFYLEIILVKSLYYTFDKDGFGSEIKFIKSLNKNALI